jgi:hypothetical protein
VAEDVDTEIVRSIKSESFDMIVLGAVDRTADSGIYLGKSVQKILTETSVPAAVFIYRSPQTKEAEADPAIMPEAHAAPPDSSKNKP